MSKKKQKYYVVWVGHSPGVYASWTECQLQIKGFPGAKYKSFSSEKEANQAYEGDSKDYIRPRKTGEPRKKRNLENAPITWDSISVDAACSGKSGDMEYRGVHTRDGSELFRQGPFKSGTNNVGEFLALVHALAYLKNTGNPELPIYTDSRTALSWLKNKKIKTTLKETPVNRKIFDLLRRAILWLKKNDYQNPILKWNTEEWGEIPADFGRK